MRDEKYYKQRTEQRSLIYAQIQRVNELHEKINGLINKRQQQLKDNEDMKENGWSGSFSKDPIIKRAVIERYFLLLQEEQRELRKLLQNQKDF